MLPSDAELLNRYLFDTDDELPPRSYVVEYVDPVTCPRCGRETHPDAVAEACRGNHWTEETT
jgi:hypothetical protein